MKICDVQCSCVRSSVKRTPVRLFGKEFEGYRFKQINRNLTDIGMHALKFNVKVIDLNIHFTTKIANG